MPRWSRAWVRAFVFLVRLTTVPALMMRSNSKQPFWLTGDMMSTLALSVLMLCIWGGSSFMPAERIATGLAGVQCRCHVGGRSHIHGRRGGRDEWSRARWWE
jgi:hypothetical protein